MKKKSGLGRGLSALLGESQNTAELETELANDSTNTGTAHIAIASIEVNPFQPRRNFDPEALAELADSIKLQGIIQPLTVRRIGGSSYQLIAGERRMRASQLAGLTTVPVNIREATDQQMLEVALIENIQREELNPLEIAHSLHRLMSECRLNQEDLGERVGKKRSTVTNYLRLLKLPPDIQTGLDSGQITMGHAKVLLGLSKVDNQLFLYKKIINDGISVRALETLATALEGKMPTTAKAPSLSKQLDALLAEVQKQLSSNLGTKVELKPKNQQEGEIRIPYFSTDDLNRLLDTILSK